MERLKNMGLKKSFLVLSASCLLLALLLVGLVFLACSSISSAFPTGGVAIQEGGSFVRLEEPTASQQRILAALVILQSWYRTARSLLGKWREIWRTLAWGCTAAKPYAGSMEEGLCWKTDQGMARRLLHLFKWLRILEGFLRSGYYTLLISQIRGVFFMNIEAKKLSKIYGGGENRIAALQEANLKIASGDFLSIMGPSGSGKSTLLHLLSGLDEPTSGSLTYDGKAIYSFRDRELSAFRRRRIGFIFQQFNLLPVLTARENIIMPLLLDKRQPDEAYLGELADLLGVRERLTHLPHELSGGQQQRVAIARALIAKPDVIFADEPTGNLDSKSGGEVMEMLQNIWRKMGKTLVVITHDSRIAKMAKRQFRMVDGILSEVNVK